MNDANPDLVLQEDRASKRQKEAEKQRGAARRQRDEAVESAVEEHCEIRKKNQGLKTECERLKGSLHRIKAAKTQQSDWAKIATLQRDNARLETENGRLQAERKPWNDIMKQHMKPYTTPVILQQIQESPPKLVATLTNLPIQSSRSEAPPSPPTSNTKIGPPSAEVEANKVQNQTMAIYRPHCHNQSLVPFNLSCQIIQTRKMRDGRLSFQTLQNVPLS